MMSTGLTIVHYGRCRGVEIAVGEGDILSADVECIAVSGNSQGMMGGGVSGAVRRAAGEEIQDEAQDLAPIRLGSTVMLSPHGLAAKGIKAVAYAAIMVKPIDSTNSDVIFRAVLSVLGEVNRKGIRSLAIPLMGAGVGRLGGLVSSLAIVKAVRVFMGEDPSTRHLKKIVFSGYYKEESLAIIQALDLLFGLPIRKCALVIVDMVDTFIGDGSLISADDADRICAGINSLVLVAADNAIPIFYVKDVHQPSDRELTYAERHGLAAPEEICFHQRLNVLEGPASFTINKNTYSAFFGTPLDAELRKLGVDTVILTGTQTHVCVKHSAAHAMMHGFRPIVVADCTVSSTPERHALGLLEVSRYLGEISSSDYIRRVLAAD